MKPLFDVLIIQQLPVMVHVRKKFAKSERHSRLKDRHRIAASKLREMDGILKLTEKYDIVGGQGSPSAVHHMLKSNTKPPQLPRLPAQQPALPQAPTKAAHTAHWVTLKVPKYIAKDVAALCITTPA